MSKKIYAALLVISVVFSSLVNAFAWDDFENDSKDFAKRLVMDLGIMKTDKESGFNDYKAVTRGELSEIIVNLGNASGAKSYRKYFDDVEADTEYAESISLLLDMEIVNGTGSSFFYPEQNATYEQAVKMIVYLLGYKQAAERESDSMKSCMKIASQLKVTDGISAGRTDTLTQGMILTLCYNALNSEMMIYENREFIKGDTLLKERFDIDKATGTVSANYKTALNSSKGTASKEYVQIDGEDFRDSTGLSADMLGMDAQIYYRDEQDDKIIIAIYATKKNQVMEIKSKDLAPDSARFDYTTIVYTNDSDIEQKVKLDSNADIIYNGRACLDVTLDLLKPSTGTMRFVDNNNDGNADVVFITEYENYVVQSVNEEGIYDKYSKRLSLEDVDVIEIEGMYGSQMTLAQIAEWNVLSVAKSKDGEVIKIICLNDPVTGSIQAIQQSDGETELTVDGETFAVADSFLQALSAGENEAKAPEIGRRGTFYLDKDEKIAAIRYDGESQWQYGFLFNAAVDENTQESFFLIMSDKSGEKKYDGSAKIRIDKIVCKRVEKIKELLNITSAPFKPILIKFALDGDGKVSEIDTAARTLQETDDSLTQVADHQEEYWSIRTGRFGIGESVGIQMDIKKTLIFQVPQTDIYNFDKYTIITQNYDNNELLLYDAYDTDNTGLAKCVVVYNEANMERPDYERLILVSSMEMRYDNEIGEGVEVIHGYDTVGQKVEFTIDDEEPKSDISRGDIVTFNVNYKGRAENVLTRFRRDDEYTMSERVFNNTGDYNSAFTSNARDYMVKTVISKKNGTNIIVPAPGIDFASMSASDLDYTNSQYYSLSDVKLFHISKSGVITEINEKELDNYTHEVNASIRAVVYSTYTQLRTVYIYE